MRVSHDGKRVVFESQDASLPGGDGSTYQVYARNLAKGKTSLLSRAGNGDPGENNSYYSSISLDGRWATFEGLGGNLGGNPSFDMAFRAGPIG